MRGSVSYMKHFELFLTVVALFILFFIFYFIMVTISMLVVPCIVIQILRLLMEVNHVNQE